MAVTRSSPLYIIVGVSEVDMRGLAVFFCGCGESHVDSRERKFLCANERTRPTTWYYCCGTALMRHEDKHFN